MSKTTITDKVIEGMTEWQNRPVYPVIFVDCVHVKIREGHVAKRPIYMSFPGSCSNAARMTR